MSTDGRKLAVITGGSSGIGYAAARVTPEKFKAARHAAQTKPKDLE
jgi:NAD(P)-dependent dehydrogenase (short-subunit alcohol dehydrogenase family)